MKYNRINLARFLRYAERELGELKYERDRTATKLAQIDSEIQAKEQSIEELRSELVKGDE